MKERDFLMLADAELARLESLLEQAVEDDGADWDYELKPGGIIEVVFADGGKIIVNRHAAAREIWVAARAGGFHFRPPAVPGGDWLDARAGEGLMTVLTRCFSEQAGVTLPPGR